MARIIDAKYATIVGTPARLRELFELLGRGPGAAAIDLKFASIIVADRPIDDAALRAAIETTPKVTA